MNHNIFNKIFGYYIQNRIKEHNDQIYAYYVKHNGIGFVCTTDALNKISRLNLPFRHIEDFILCNFRMFDKYFTFRDRDKIIATHEVPDDIKRKIRKELYKGNLGDSTTTVRLYGVSDFQGDNVHIISENYVQKCIYENNNLIYAYRCPFQEIKVINATSYGVVLNEIMNSEKKNAETIHSFIFNNQYKNSMRSYVQHINMSDPCGRGNIHCNDCRIVRKALENDNELYNLYLQWIKDHVIISKMI